MRHVAKLLPAVLALAFLGNAAAPAAADRWALLVGVNEYPQLAAPFQLRGCENDARAMSSVLAAKYGFDRQKIKLLLNREATRAAIEKTFRAWLIDQAQAGDTVFFHFSGHGSQIEDRNGDEDDGLDETLCPADVSPAAPERQISDDTIAAWIEQLHRKDVRDILFVLDSCHSGTATKGLLPDAGLSRPRYVDPAILLGHPLLPRERSLETGERAAPDAPADVAVISGCHATQQSNDARFGEAYHGALTYHLHAVLQNASPRTTYAELMREVCRRVQAQFPTQTPQFEGPAERGILASPAAAPARPFVVLTRVSGSQAQLAAGASATVGSLYTVYSPADNGLTGKGIGQVEITAVRQAAATARILPGAGALQAGCRAVEESHCYPPEKLFVRVDAAPETAADLQTALRHLDYLALPDAGRAADRVIRVTAGAGRLRAQMVTPDGLPGRTCTGADGAALAAALQPELENAFTIKLLTRLENPNPDFPVRLFFDREENPVYYYGRDSMRLRVRADRDCYITVLDVGTSGKITVLFPNKFHPENKIRAGQEYPIPPAEAGFQLTVGPPAGREMVKVIATEKPLNLTGLDFAGMQGAFAGLPDSLAFVKNLANQVRDFVVVGRPQAAGGATPTAGWATDFVTFQIREPAE